MIGEEAEKAILQYIIEYKRQNDGTSPSWRQIRKECQISSTSMVSYYLDKLESQGKIKVGSGVRTIQVVGGEWRMPA